MANWVHRYVVFRFDEAMWQKRPSQYSPLDFIQIKEMFNHSENAEREVQRLNALSQKKGCHYRWQSAKYYPFGREVPDSDSVLKTSSSESVPGERIETTKYKVSLRFKGMNLSPEHISQCLGVSGVKSKSLGDGRRIWLYQHTYSGTQSEPDLNDILEDLFAKLTAPVEIWKDISETAHGDIFVGVFGPESSLGFQLSPSVLSKISERDLLLDFDIYGL